MKRTNKMAAAFSKAVHEAIDNGVNTGRIGRLVLTHEASQRASNRMPNNLRRKEPSSPRQQAGYVDGESLFVVGICVLGLLLLASPLLTYIK